MQGIADAGEIVVRIDVLALYAALTAVAAVHPTCKGEVWPEPTREMRPWVYNWWHASAIDEEGMEVQCAELEAKGFGGFHVIHIYGVNGPDGNYRDRWRTFLSPQWVEAWNMAVRKARSHNLDVDLTMGSGWNYGGPWIPESLALSSKTKVMRCGPGGEGFMIDPFNPESMKAHVAAFEPLFGKGGAAERPRAFYHDSYEYFGARPRGGVDIDKAQVATFRVWSDWCRENGYITRNQAHGAPANWLDLYALADIPETEMFGRSRNILMAKFASSAAHVKGTRLVAAETCTWVDEHFCERPREVKSFIDRLFISGVNHVFYHGMCYSPQDAQWPGWCFYATWEMNPRNPIWREIGAVNDYVIRCQSLFQTWTCDNDLLVLWDSARAREQLGGGFDSSGKYFGKTKTGRLAKRLFENGYAFDYISPLQATGRNAGAYTDRYAELIDPEKGEMPRLARKMPFSAVNGLMATRWKTPDGKTAYFVVNQSDIAREIHAKKQFVVLDPLTGRIATVAAYTLDVGHSSFFVGDGFEVGESPASTAAVLVVNGRWTVSPVEGGPRMPRPRTIDGPRGWETWDETFAGTMLYETSFDCASPMVDVIDLGDVREIGRVRLNGVDIGVCFMPPYRFNIPKGVLKPLGNRLEVEVTGLGANRIRDLDRRKLNWKYFCDRNVFGSNYRPLDASCWPVRESGLLGPVLLRRSDGEH